jgi:transposase
LDASEESVSRWLARARHGGLEALLAHPAPGCPPKVSDVQKRRIPEFLIELDLQPRDGRIAHEVGRVRRAHHPQKFQDSDDK